MSNRAIRAEENLGNTKQDSQCIRWIFTLNNYSESDYNEIIQFLDNRAKVYIVGKEVGENGTPHLQGYFNLKVRERFSGLKKILPKCHIEKAKGSEKSNYDYCSKEGNFVSKGFKVVKAVKCLTDTQLHNWQREIINIISNEADDRSIYWYWEPVGCSGKTSFCKYLSIKYGAIPIEGKKNDILYCAAIFESEIYVMDIERSMEDFVSYAAIEKIKNGYYMCAKYESKPVIRNCPHLFIFANFEPDLEMLSADRWVVRRI